MLSLTKELEHNFFYKGREYELDLSFDCVLRWYEMMEDKELTKLEKAETGFEIFFHACVLDYDFLLKSTELLADYIQQKSYGNNARGLADSTPSEPEKYYSYTQDAEAIYASFKGQYGIDLIDMQGKLHWDKFKALFDGLNEETYFKRIISIRTRDTSELKDKALSDLLKAQDYYMLDENRSVEAQQSKLTDIFNSLRATAIKH